MEFDDDNEVNCKAKNEDDPDTVVEFKLLEAERNSEYLKSESLRSLDENLVNSSDDGTLKEE